MSDKPKRWLLRLEYEKIFEQFLRGWELYLKVYTVLLTLNLAAIGVVLQYVDKGDRLLIVTAFVVQNICIFITALAMGSFSKQTDQRIQEIIKAILNIDESEFVNDFPYQNQSPVSTYIAWRGSLATAMIQLTLIVCWIIISQMDKSMIALP